MKLDFEIEAKGVSLDFELEQIQVVNTGGGVSEARVRQIIDEVSVKKENEPKVLYGTDENGNPALYPTDSVGTQVLVDGQKVKEFNADEKFDKTGGVVGGDVTIQGNLYVSGENSVTNTETLRVKDNVIVANDNGVKLVENGGFAIKTNETEAYGIMYDPLGDGVKIGLGGFTEDGKFVYNEGQAQFLATRADNITDGNLPQWDNDKKQFVDSGKKIGDYVKFTDYATKTKAGLVYIKSKGFGIDLNGGLYLMGASRSDVYSRGSGDIPVTPSMIDYAWKVSATDNKEKWTDEDKAKACETIGAVKQSEVSAVLVGGTIPKRFVSGQILVGDPTTDHAATPKKWVETYVDENKGTKLYLHEMNGVSLIDNSAEQKTPEGMVQALSAKTSIERRFDVFGAQIISASTRLVGLTSKTQIDIYFYNDVTNTFEKRNIDFTDKTDTVTEL